MTEKRYDKDNPRFRDEFGCVNDLLTGESYVCGNSAMVGERDAIDTAIVLCDLLNSLYDENEQLKQRNDRQAKQLGNIYKLIEEKDWRALSDIIDDFKRCDEQLKREGGHYE